ncbi:hypothetical protein Pint_05197 [Pistacia integerrima]|uniref:Uncharacterized protein n=1 Tax=Pistacia integerrima TaxID=434235 RepID=A0ACC0Z853_9ROSI|nr:hypothetical protein Pint_05197 [Pistacia integerrima]
MKFFVIFLNQQQLSQFNNKFKHSTNLSWKQMNGIFIILSMYIYNHSNTHIDTKR